jgi:CRISPR-associated protein Cmr4
VSQLPAITLEDGALCDTNCPNTITKNGQNIIVFEDLDLNATQNNESQQWRNHLADTFGGEGKYIVIVSDNVFSYLAETATEIRTRVKIDEKKGVVEQGALWTEENLPSETVLWGLLGLGKVRGKHANGEDCSDHWAKCNPKDQLLQMGGKTTVGRGLVRWRCTDDTMPQPAPTGVAS